MADGKLGPRVGKPPTRANTKFAEDVAEMMLDRFFADLEVLGYFLICVSGIYGGNNLKLSGSRRELLLTGFVI
jgi:hypothetical protein